MGVVCGYDDVVVSDAIDYLRYECFSGVDCDVALAHEVFAWLEIELDFFAFLEQLPLLVKTPEQPGKPATIPFHEAHLQPGKPVKNAAQRNRSERPHDSKRSRKSM